MHGAVGRPRLACVSVGYEPVARLGRGGMGVVDLATHQNITDVKTESGFHTEGYLPGAHLVYAYLNTSNKIQVDTVNTP